tara:strand:+ start:1494 stop:1766 length:273 start_codon:yes stop_codon:yes gene_type:complete
MVGSTPPLAAKERKMLWILLIYLAGYVTSYLVIKKAVRDGSWKLSDRVFCLVVSLGSWMSVIAGLITGSVLYISEPPVGCKIDWDKEVKW